MSDKLDKAGISMELSKEVARLFWRSKFKLANPDASEDEMKAAWELEKEENRQAMRHALRVMKKKGIELQRA